jgi:hypothetical protein
MVRHTEIGGRKIVTTQVDNVTLNLPICTSCASQLKKRTMRILTGVFIIICLFIAYYVMQKIDSGRVGDSLFYPTVICLLFGIIVMPLATWEYVRRREHGANISTVDLRDPLGNTASTNPEHRRGQLQSVLQQKTFKGPLHRFPPVRDHFVDSFVTSWAFTIFPVFFIKMDP